MRKLLHRLCILALLVPAVLARTEGQQEEGKKDLEKLQGTWQLVRATIDGDPLGEDQVKKCRFAISGNKFTLTVGDQTSKGTVKLDESRKPKRLAIMPPSDVKNLGVLHMIYVLDGDELRTCHTGEPGKEPPPEFASKKGSGHILEVFRKVKGK